MLRIYISIYSITSYINAWMHHGYSTPLHKLTITNKNFEDNQKKKAQQYILKLGETEERKGKLQ